MKHSLSCIILFPLLLLGGCYVETETVYVEPDDHYWDENDDPPPVSTSRIDSDAVMEDVQPGIESGVYIEYLSGGLWTIYTTCGDVAEYGACEWDIVTTTAPGEFVAAEGYELDAGEVVEFDDLGAWLVAYTEYDFDGMIVQTAPGASLTVDALLDGDSADDYMFWVSGGDVLPRAPSNPVELVPTVP